jgi:hypothetical protein
MTASSSLQSSTGASSMAVNHTSAFQSKALPSASATRGSASSSSTSTTASTPSSHPSITARITRTSTSSKKPEPPSLKAPVSDKTDATAPLPHKKVSMSDKACQFGSGAPVAGGKNSVSSLCIPSVILLRSPIL